MTTPKFYITTAISYPNGAPHIGHAYEALATDAHGPLQRLDGYDVYFLTGTDEHGIKMKQTARAKGGSTPQALADRNAPLFQNDGRGARLLATTISSAPPKPRHHRSSEEIWRRMEANGDIYKDKYAGWYSVRDEAYYAEIRDRGRHRRRPPRPAGHAGRMGGGGELLLPPVRLSGPAARPLRRPSGVHRPGRAPQRGGRASSRAASGTCRSRARPSTGASACPATTST